MRKTLAFVSTVLTVIALASCGREGIPADGRQDTPSGPAIIDADSYYAYAQFTVPCGTREVMVEYYGLNRTGNTVEQVGLKSKKVEVTPVMPELTDGKDPEPFGNVTLLLESPERTLASVYYTVGGTVPAVETKTSAYADRSGEAQYVIVDLPVDQPGSVVKSKAPADPLVVLLDEPQPYVTTDEDQAFYHSSGVVMFEDSWPSLNAGINDEDFNDMVVDYDIEAKTVADAQLESQGWREQVKVVLHVRTVGTGEVWRVGMILEDFNMHNVANVVEYKTLDSYNSGHGELPQWTVKTIQENSLHYDPLATEYATNVWDRPAVEIGGLQRYNETGRGAGTEVYIYQNNDGPVEHVMNPALKQYQAVWRGPHTDQYDPSLADDKTLPKSLDYIQNQVYYNVVPGYVNVAGGLYTYTVVYEMKPRAQMTPAEREAVKQNMIDAVVNTTAQNFFVVKKDYTPVGLKGYAPVDFSAKNYSDYSAKYKQQFNANKDHLSADTYYKGIHGEVWGFKCPTLTRHLWNKMPFARAYPNYHSWVESNGETNKDWYVSGIDTKYLTCWW